MKSDPSMAARGAPASKQHGAWLLLCKLAVSASAMASSAHGYSPDLSVLGGLSNSEAAEKLSSDPLLLTQLLNQVDIEAASSTASQETCGSELGSEACPREQRFTMRTEGPGRSPYDGYAAGTEFLGIGYNFITGNPRGSLTSDLDPGFGFPVLALAPDLPTFSVTRDSKTCAFSSEANDITSTRDMQETLNRESSEDTSFSFGASGSVPGRAFTPSLPGTITFGVSQNRKFSRSQKLNQFQMEKETTNTVTLENQAICIDYQIEIHPYAYDDLTLDPNFVNATDELPTTFDATNAEDVALFRRFLDTYGTHFISQLDMGGKFVVSSEIATRDYQSLTTRKIDVKSSYDFDASYDLGYSQTASSNRATRARAQAREWTDKVDLEYLKTLKPTCCAGETNMAEARAAYREIRDKKNPPSPPPPPAPGTPPPPPPPPAPARRQAFSINASVKNSRNEKSSVTRETKDQESVTSVITKTTVYNLGGVPPASNERWQSWAATVPSNPMPVAYKSVPIWHMPEFAPWRAAYANAVFHLEGVRLDEIDEDAEQAFRYGVLRSSGEAISKYSDSPNRHTRANLELQYLPATQFSSDVATVYQTDQTDESGSDVGWTPYIGAPADGYFACGLQAQWHLARRADNRGLTGLSVRFCSAAVWTDQDEQVIHRGRSGFLSLAPSLSRGISPALSVATYYPWKMCNRDQYIVQVRALTHENVGIESLEIRCATIDGNAGTSYSADGFEDIVPIPESVRRAITGVTPRRNDPQPASIIPGKLIQSVRVQFGSESLLGDDMGINGMQMAIADSDREGGPPSPIYYYQSYWDVQSRVVSPVFATPIRGKVVINVRETFRQLSITNPRGQLNLESAAMYTFMDEPARPKIAFTDFKNDIEESDLPSFSFLLANDPSEILMNQNIVSGVVHADGYIISSSSGQSPEVKVSFESRENPELATISFGNSLAAANTHVSLLVSPVWFPDAELSYPSNAGDVTVASSPCEQVEDEGNWKCYVHLGTARNLAAENHLGFSFMAVGNMYSSAAHGSVKMSGYTVDEDGGSKLFRNVTAESSFSSSGRQFRVWAGDGDLSTINLANQKTGGVTITFDPPFEDTPSIIISPVVSRSSAFVHAGTDLMSLPHAFVEHITSQEALVRVGMVNTYEVGVVAKTEACDNLSNVHQSWILKFKVFGQIELGNTPGRRICFEETADGFVDAEPCDGSMKQMFVYDGTRIRSYEDPSKCTWIKAGERLHIHQCGSDSDVIDDEPIDFMPRDDGSMSLHTKFNRCLVRRGTQILLSGRSDSNCGATAGDRAYSVNVPADFSNMVECQISEGFQLATSGFDAPTRPMDFTQRCLSYSTSSQELQPLGDCDTTSWLLSLDSAGGSNYMIQLVHDGTELYLDRNSETNELSVSSTGSEFNLDSGLFEPLTLFNMRQKLQSSRLRLFGTDQCIQWERNLNDNSIYTVDSIFEPMDFNFFAIAPNREVPASAGAALNVHAEKVAPLEEFADGGDSGFNNGASANLRAGIVKEG